MIAWLAPLHAKMLAPHLASAATVAPQTISPGIEAADVHKAQWGDDWRYRRRYDYDDRYYDRCHAWRRECARRWGWGGWEFRRCLRCHGCARGSWGY